MGLEYWFGKFILRFKCDWKAGRKSVLLFTFWQVGEVVRTRPGVHNEVFGDGPCWTVRVETLLLADSPHGESFRVRHENMNQQYLIAVTLTPFLEAAETYVSEMTRGGGATTLRRKAIKILTGPPYLMYCYCRTFLRPTDDSMRRLLADTFTYQG